jgi:hypothetical protein
MESGTGGGVSAAALYTTTLGAVLKSFFTWSKSAGIESGLVKSTLRLRIPEEEVVLLPLRDAVAIWYPREESEEVMAAPTLGPAPRTRATGLEDMVLRMGF